MHILQGVLLVAWTLLLSAIQEAKTARKTPRVQGLCQDETRRRRTTGEAMTKDPVLEIQAWFDTTQHFAVIRVTVCGFAEPFCFVSAITGVMRGDYINDAVLWNNLLSTFQGDGKIEPLDQYRQNNYGRLSRQERKRKLLDKLGENINRGSHVIYKLCKDAQVYMFVPDEEKAKPTKQPRRDKKRRNKVRKSTKLGEEKTTNNTLKDFISNCFKQKNESCSRICVGQNTMTDKVPMECKKFRIQCLFKCTIPLNTGFPDLTGSDGTESSSQTSEGAKIGSPH